MGTPETAPRPEKSTYRRPRQRWEVAEQHPEQASQLATSAHLPLVVAELLVHRGISNSRDAFIFLNPEISQLHDPYRMLGMDLAVARLERAIAEKKPILLYGDYDVDGTTAVVLLKTAIEMLGGVVRFHVPHRIREGYGLQSNVLEAAHADGVKLVITVDTGMRAFAEAQTARRLGLDLIVTDHHLPDAADALPEALAILNPNQAGCAYPEKSLCGAAARAREKTLPSFLKLAAIATIADAVPLRGENRVIAALGLKELRRPVGIGLRALFAAAELDPASKQVTGFDVAFRIAPRINAAGRMDIASEVIELFTTRDSLRATELATKLERLNRERRDTEAHVLRVIEERLATDDELVAQSLLVLDGDGWHRGVIGILASRVVERTAKPAIVVCVEDGIAHGSGRSVDGFPLLAAIETCADLFTRFGGHAFAVGFALPAERLPELKRRLCHHAAERLAAREPERVLQIHAELPLDRVTSTLAGWLRKLEPLGHGNPEPTFVARKARLLSPVRLMKDRHLRLELAHDGGDSMMRNRAGMKAIGWDMAFRATELGLTEGSVVDVAYRVRENDHPQYGGIEIEILGLEPAAS